MGKSGNILALDQGTTSSRAIVFGPDLGCGAWRSASSPSIIPADRAGSSTTRRTSGARRVETARAGASAARLQRRRYRRHRHHQPARDLRYCGIGAPASRSTTPSSGRTGAPPTCAAAEAAGPRAGDHGARPACCSTPTSRRPRSPGCSIMWRARAHRPRPASLLSARSTVSCCGA